MTDETENAILVLLQAQIETNDHQHAELKGIVESTRDEVTALSGRFDLHEQNDQHVHESQANRIASLEEAAEATGQHKVVALEKTISTWKNRGWSLVAALILAGFVGLVTHWLHTH